MQAHVPAAHVHLRMHGASCSLMQLAVHDPHRTVLWASVELFPYALVSRGTQCRTGEQYGCSQGELKALVKPPDSRQAQNTGLHQEIEQWPRATGKVEDLGTGEYRARFMATAAGTHSVWLQHKGQNIAGSPFTAEVAHSAIAADCSYVVQEGLERGVTGSQVRVRYFRCEWEWCVTH